mgnify:CR=1 FL=1
MKISGLVLTLNSEASIERALRSLHFCDEIIVVDSGSTDATVTICQRFGAKVFFNPWNGFAEQKKFGLQKASFEWIFVLDSDEEASAELQEFVLNFKKNSTRFEGVSFKRVMFVGNKRYDVIWRNERRVRLFKKSAGSFLDNEPHERILVNGDVLKTDFEIFHYSYKNLEDQVSKLFKYATVWANRQEKIRCVILRAVISFFSRFVKTYILKLGFLAGREGFILCFNEAYYGFLKYALTFKRD